MSFVATLARPSLGPEQDKSCPRSRSKPHERIEPVAAGWVSTHKNTRTAAGRLGSVRRAAAATRIHDGTYVKTNGNTYTKVHSWSNGRPTDFQETELGQDKDDGEEEEEDDNMLMP
eukprot:scaffold294_cov221-Amphora_coffeaeformis.AAC.13